MNPIFPLIVSTILVISASSTNGESRKVTGDNVVLRAQPSVQSAQLALLKKGDTVEILLVSPSFTLAGKFLGRWTRVATAAGLSGYVLDTFLLGLGSHQEAFHTFFDSFEMATRQLKYGPDQAPTNSANFAYRRIRYPLTTTFVPWLPGSPPAPLPWHATSNRFPLEFLSAMVAAPNLPFSSSIKTPSEYSIPYHTECSHVWYFRYADGKWYLIKADFSG